MKPESDPFFALKTSFFAWTLFCTIFDILGSEKGPSLYWECNENKNQWRKFTLANHRPELISGENVSQSAARLPTMSHHMSKLDMSPALDNFSTNSARPIKQCPSFQTLVGYWFKFSMFLEQKRSQLRNKEKEFSNGKLPHLLELFYLKYKI